MSYIDIGYTDTLTRQENLISTEQQLDPLQFEQFTQDIPGSKMSGLIQSQDEKIQIDLDNNAIIISDGVTERVRLGKLEDGTYGFLIRDNNNNILMQISEIINLMQSSDEKMTLDFTNSQIIIKDEGGTPRVLIGKF